MYKISSNPSKMWYWKIKSERLIPTVLLQDEALFIFKEIQRDLFIAKNQGAIPLKLISVIVRRHSKNFFLTAYFSDLVLTNSNCLF